MDVLREGSPLILESASISSALSDVFDPLNDLKNKIASGKVSDEHSSMGSSITESTQAGERGGGTANGHMLPLV